MAGQTNYIRVFYLKRTSKMCSVFYVLYYVCTLKNKVKTLKMNEINEKLKSKTLSFFKKFQVHENVKTIFYL